MPAPTWPLTATPCQERQTKPLPVPDSRASELPVVAGVSTGPGSPSGWNSHNPCWDFLYFKWNYEGPALLWSIILFLSSTENEDLNNSFIIFYVLVYVWGVCSWWVYIWYVHDGCVYDMCVMGVYMMYTLWVCMMCTWWVCIRCVHEGCVYNVCMKGVYMMCAWWVCSLCGEDGWVVNEWRVGD